jgi:hypothetical protein
VQHPAAGSSAADPLTTFLSLFLNQTLGLAAAQSCAAPALVVAGGLFAFSLARATVRSRPKALLIAAGSLPLRVDRCIMCHRRTPVQPTARSETRFRVGSM